jgi:hypothetical protein
MRTLKDSRVYTANEAIDLAKKIAWLNNSGFRYTINFGKGVDREDVVIVLWEEEFEEEAIEADSLDD